MMVCSSMWPMCSEPVTFGGGMTSENISAVDEGLGVKQPRLIHHSAQCGSNRWGS